MAIFGWKKGNDAEKDQAAASTPPGTVSGGDAGTGGFDYSPEKGKRWFDHARVSHEAGNFEYAMRCWLSGLRFDPGNLESVKAFTASAKSFTEQTKKGPTKEVTNAITGRTDVDKYLNALLEWACKPLDPALAVSAVGAAANIGLTIISLWMMPTALKVALADPKPRKSNFVRLMDIAEKQEQFDLAVQAGEAAYRLDPADNKLSAYVRNLSAQSTMSRGGYEKTGQEGGFRQNVRDLDKQRMMDETDRISKSEGTIERMLVQAKAEYEASPLDKPTIRKYATALLQRSAPGDDDMAYDLLIKAYTETQEFGFRQNAGEIRVRQGRRALKALQSKLEGMPENAPEREAFTAAYQAQLRLEAGEFELRVKAYPTNMELKLDLGKRYFELGKHQEAIDQFQQAKADTKLRGPALYALGLSFQAIGWDDEAIDTFRAGLEGLPDQNDAAAIDLKYGLMCSLQRRADEMKDLPSAEEALKLVSNITMQQISFKDARARRDQIKALVLRLKGGPTP
ncbi:MAG: hypothetical protein ACT4PL_03060 [Phycisphaerales bacterium]